MAKSSETRLRLPPPVGGISSQPAHIRHPTQIEDADNAVFAVEDGMRMRPGTVQEAKITTGSMVAAGNYRMHPIERDDTELYRVIYGPKSGGGTLLRIFQVDGVEATVNITAAAQTYLDNGSPTADDLVLRSITDTTFILNKKVVAKAKTAAFGIITKEHRDFDTLLSHTPATATIHKTNKDTSTEPKGHFSYDASTGTFATRKFVNANTGWSDPSSVATWQNANNPWGFTVGYGRFTPAAGAHSWVEATKRLTLAGSFTNYTFSAGDELKVIAGGTGVVGWHAIKSKIDNDTIEMEATITSPPGDNAGILVESIGIEVEMAHDFTVDASATDMHDIALAIEQTLRSAGAQDALCSWVDETLGVGHFVLTSPFRGADSRVFNITSPTTAGVGDLTIQAGNSLVPTGSTETVGTGTPTTDKLAPTDRWTKVAEPGQEQAEIDNTTMPIKLVRTTAGSPAIFDADVIAWNPRTSGGKESNPVPSIWKDGVTKINDIAFHRNRLVLAGDEHIVFSQAGDLFNFFNNDFDNIVDSDPIDLDVGEEEVSIIEFLVPWRRTIAIFTRAGRQFELNAPDSLTPKTASITATTTYESLNIRPVTIGATLYFAARVKGLTILYEYFFDDGSVSNAAEEITAHVFDLLPNTIENIVSSTNNNTIIVRDKDKATMFVYTQFFRGTEKQQSAWGKYVFDSGYRIVDIAIIENECLMLVEFQGQYFLEDFALTRETAGSQSAGTAFPYVIHLDRRIGLNGTFAAGETSWALTYEDETYDAIVLGPAFGANNGKVISNDADVADIKQAITFSTAGGVTTYKTAGDYSAGTAVLGRTFMLSTQLSRPYRRDFQGNADLDSKLQIRKVTTTHDDETGINGQYSIQATMPQRANREKFFKRTNRPQDQDGRLAAWLNGDSAKMKLFIKNKSPRPCVITGIQYLADYEPKAGQ